MKIKRKLKFAVIISVIVIFLIGLYLFFFGRLTFINPWVIGFQKMETQKAIIYYHENVSDITCLSKIDSLIDRVETFHKLRFQRKVEVVVSANFQEQKRYTWNNGTFISQPFFGRLYIPYSENYFVRKNIPLYAYIQHELSHSIIYHNISNSKLINYPLWFMEGIATYSSGMIGIEGYPKRDTVNKRISEGYFIQPNDWGKYGMPSTGLSVRNYPYKDIYWFAYSEFGYIIEDLIEEYGEPKLIYLLHLSIKEKRFDEAFETVYKMKFDNYIDIYLKNILQMSPGLKDGADSDIQ